MTQRFWNWLKGPKKPRFTIKYEPGLGMQGVWVIFERFGDLWVMPVTSRSSKESAEYWIAQRGGEHDQA